MSAPKSFLKTLEKFKHFQVSGLYVGRHPINRVLKYIVNFITRGAFNRKQRELGYDDVFHLYLLIKINHNGQDKILMLHKEATIKVHELTDVE